MGTTKDEWNKRLEQYLELIEIPISYYEKAVQRYESLQAWFKRKASAIARYDPIVFPQGSFRLGLVIRPLTPEEEYDLDIVCQLLLLSKGDLTQRQLKELVGAEVRAYAAAHSIESPVEERKRAWRLDYADSVKFHIDVLPCIPEDDETIRTLIEEHEVARELAASAAALTCKSHAQYSAICSDWPSSNPIGFGSWFDQRMGVAALDTRMALVRAGRYEKVEQVPLYELKTPLQRSIQILKRHRDTMFRDEPELKPISMIITTLAASAYQGERSLHDTISGVLRRMPEHVEASWPRVKNPVNPGEDFADKWSEKPVLEENFWMWHSQASRDMESLVKETDLKRVAALSKRSLGLSLSEAKLLDLAGVMAASVAAVAPAVIVGRDAPKPWSNRHD